MGPKPALLRGYIDLELRLGEVDRVRKLYDKSLGLDPGRVDTWLRYASLEKSLGEDERARALYELAIAQPSLDAPELLWKGYIDSEIEGGETAAARALYSRLLARTQHVKVWLSAAALEAGVVGDADAARAMYAAAYAHFRGLGEEGKESRALIAETWAGFESALRDDAVSHGGDVAKAEALVAAATARLPSRVVRRRELPGGGAEEYADFLFPDDVVKPAGVKLLELAQRWKKAGAGGVEGVLGAGAKRPRDEAELDLVEPLDEDAGRAGEAAEGAGEGEATGEQN